MKMAVVVADQQGATMVPAHQDFISRSSAVIKALLELQGDLVQLNELWAGGADFDALITQGEIDSVPAYEGAGLTTAVLADAEFVMAGIKDAINNGVQSFSIMANLP